MSLQKISHHTKVKKREWHARSPEVVLEEFDTQEVGLSHLEAKERLRVYGRNEFSEETRPSWILKLFEQCKSPLTVVLFVAFVITFTLKEYIDASVIFFALSIAIVVGLLQEEKASRAFKKLAGSQTNNAFVFREGKKHEIPSAELVPGDIVYVQSGMHVPADIRIFESKNLSTNEAPLTGEWMLVDKESKAVDVGTPLAEMSSMLWLGTHIATGYGKGIVVGTGDKTTMGSLAEDLQTIVEVETPIQGEMKHVSRVVLMVIGVFVVGIFALGILRGEPLEAMLLTSIAIAVASIPEGLPAAVTIVLAVGMEALFRKGGLVRNLLAAETLGSTTYILTDKTGTLTEARMAVTNVLYHGCSDVNSDMKCDWNRDAHAKRLLNVALCASDAFLDERKEGNELYVVQGEPMERAILEAAQDIGLPLQGESLRGKRVDYFAFESENRFAAGLAKTEQGFELCFNGAPELLLSESSKVLCAEGVIEITKETKSFFLDHMLKETKQGKRLIGVAYKSVSYDQIPEKITDTLNNLTFLGLIVIDDPVRGDIEEAIRGVLGAGAQIRLVTGDNAETALAVARQVGIAREYDVALTGDHIAQLDDQELLKAIKTTRVFARVLPRQKLRLAQVLQASGEIVAMTGDGINDAPALLRANIGISIGSGTEVAKEASDLVLVNDTFSTIYYAIEEGRRITGNLKKIVGYLLATSFSEVVLIGGALISGGALPLLPAQILWANIIEEGLMSVAFAFEPGDKNAMKEKPHDIEEEGILSKDMMLFVGMVIAVLSVLLLALYAYLRAKNVSVEELRSVMFLAISLDSLFVAFSFRSLSIPVWKVSLLTNKFFIGSFVLSLSLFAVILSVPFFQTVFSYQPLPVSDLILVLCYGILSMVTIEAAKYLFFERKIK